jgi:dihydroflavonol-4-reductase
VVKVPAERRKMKVLVTGATGFIGGNLVRKLRERGYAVRALVRPSSNRVLLRGLDIEEVPGDLLEPPSLDEALRGCEALFHAAAQYTFWAPHPETIYLANVVGTVNVLTAARRAGTRKVVYTSTEATVGMEGREPATEALTAAFEELPGHYKRSKLLAERVARWMCREGLPLVVVNPTMPIGPGDLKPTPTGKVIVDFLNRRMPAFVRTGMNVVDVEDVAEGHILALERGQIGQRYILGNRNVTFREILMILERITGLSAPRVRLPLFAAMGAAFVDELISGMLLRRPPRIPISAVQASRKVRHFDCSRAVRELGMPQNPIEKSFERAVRWFRDNGYVRQSGAAP